MRAAGAERNGGDYRQQTLGQVRKSVANHPKKMEA
jgi:hypothetical protein